MRAQGDALKVSGWLIFALVLALLVWLWSAGVFDLLADSEWMREQVERAGWLAPLMYVLLMLAAFPIAGGPVVWLAPAIWPIPLALFYASIASLFCSCLMFIVVRGFARDWVASRLPEKVKAYEEKVEAHPWRTLVILRLIMWINPWVDALVALSQISGRTYLLATVVVLVPMNLLHILFVTFGFDAIASLFR